METPEKPEIRKAYVKHDGELLYGTLYSAPRNFLEVPRDRGSNIRSPLAVLEPDWMTFEEAHKLDLPDGWEQKHYWRGTGDALGMFIAHWFEVEHGLEFKHPHGGRMPKEILWLLSGHLQRGEACNYRNYQRYCQFEGLKFLPLLITHTHYRFFVFRPILERVEAAVETFSNSIDRLRELSIRDKAEGTLASVRIDEIKSLVRIEDKPWYHPDARRCLGSVYRDLKGPQDAVRFIPS